MFTTRAQKCLWSASRRSGSLVRFRRSVFLKLVATLIAGLMVAGSAPQVWALPAGSPGTPLLPAAPVRPALPPPAATPATAAPAVLVPARLTPLKLERVDAAGAPLRTLAVDDPWLAFDRGRRGGSRESGGAR